MQKIQIVTAVLILAGASWLTTLVDDGLDMSWPQNVVRNWEQFGIFSLHGKLVINPGGFEAATNPEVYQGMSPVCLYPVYGATKLFAWTGLGTMSFHILLALAVLWGTWKLLGRDPWALTIAAAAILSPGYMRYQKYLDPNALSVLPVIPYAAIVLAILKQQNPRFPLMIGLSLLTLGFMSLNWTTAWVCGPCILLFLGISGVNRRTLLCFIAMTVVCALLIVVGSALVKSGSEKSGTGSADLTRFVRGYTWGNVGYGEGLTTGKAFLRLAFLNSIALFPLLLALGCATFGRFRHRRFSWMMISPFALTTIEVAFMRNYFGIHPWMAGPVFLVGIIFSLVLLRDVVAENEMGITPVFQKPLFAPATVSLCFVYGLAVLIFFRANEMNLLSLVKLVRQHTARTQVIVIAKNLDPETAALASRLDELLDRHVVVVDDFKNLAKGKDHRVILSATQLTGPFGLVAQTSAPSRSWLNGVADWFNRSISRRRAGDRLELSGNYFLYEPKIQAVSSFQIGSGMATLTP